MATTNDNSMPPRPECEFDFNLPHGIDTEDGVPRADGPTTSPGGNEAMEDVQQIDKEPVDDAMDDLFNDPEPNDAVGADDPDDEQQTMYYNTLPKGFSDDEGGEEAFDRSWTAHQARKASPKQKKSPRRSEDDDGDDESSPRIKRPRKSLFGGPDEEVDNEQLENRIDGQDEDLIDDHDHDRIDNQQENRIDNQNEERAHDQEEDLVTHKAARPDIRQRMSRVNLDQQEAQDDRPFNLGFGLGSSERDSTSPRPSRAASEESVDIPPDDKVS